MEANIDEQIKKLLEKIDRKLSLYSQYSEEEALKLIISDRMETLKDSINTRKSMLKKVKESNKQKEEIENIISKKYNTKELEYSWARALSLISLKLRGIEESEKELLRANYNLKSNNQIFRILDLIYNGNIQNTYAIDENNHILKTNILFYLVNYIFETIKSDLDFDMLLNLQDSQIETEIDKILSKYNGDAQTLGEVFSSNFMRVESLNVNHPNRVRYRQIREYLVQKGFDGRFGSRFKTLRNTASHGEFYPDFDKMHDIKFELDSNGRSGGTIDYFDMISFIETKLDVLNSKQEIATLLKLYRSNNLSNTILNMIETEEGKEELVKNLCILAVFNNVQYNNENHFRINKQDDNDHTSYVDGLDVTQYFHPSYSLQGKTSYDILETVKNAIGHMNISYSNGIFTFNNKMVNEECTCNLLEIIKFITTNEIYKVTASTAYYERLSTITDKIYKWFRGYYNSNSIQNLLDILMNDEVIESRNALLSDAVPYNKLHADKYYDMYKTYINSNNNTDTKVQKKIRNYNKLKIVV